MNMKQSRREFDIEERKLNKIYQKEGGLLFMIPPCPVCGYHPEGYAKETPNFYRCLKCDYPVEAEIFTDMMLVHEKEIDDYLKNYLPGRGRLFSEREG
jgi:hypothetical protein